MYIKEHLDMCILYLHDCKENRQFLLHANVNPSLKHQFYTTFVKTKVAEDKPKGGTIV